MQQIKDLLQNKINDFKAEGKKMRGGINHEHQAYGAHLAEKLQDKGKITLYMRYAKIVPRALLDDALAFCEYQTGDKPLKKLFMWKLYELIEVYDQEHPDQPIKPRLHKRRKKKTASEGNNYESSQLNEQQIGLFTA